MLQHIALKTFSCFITSWKFRIPIYSTSRWCFWDPSAFMKRSVIFWAWDVINHNFSFLNVMMNSMIFDIYVWLCDDLSSYRPQSSNAVWLSGRIRVGADRMSSSWKIRILAMALLMYLRWPYIPCQWKSEPQLLIYASPTLQDHHELWHSNTYSHLNPWSSPSLNDQ